MRPPRLFLPAALGSVFLLQHVDPYAGLPDPRVASLLREMNGGGVTQNIPPQDGRYLHDLIVRNDLKAGLEVGASSACSGIWLGSAFRRTGGRLITLESDPERYRMAAAFFRKAELNQHVELRLAEAPGILVSLNGPFDFVFLDTRWADYNRLLELILPKVRPGGFIAAHDVANQRARMSDFLSRITGDHSLRTELVALSRAGLSITQQLK